MLLKMCLLFCVNALQIFKSRDPSAHIKMKKQVVAMEATGHCNILKTYDHFDAEGDPFYVVSFVTGSTAIRLRMHCLTRGQVMELAPGGELFDHCVNVVGSSRQPNPPMPERGLQLAARQILRGLAHAHLRGIVHLDLKMENILLKNPVTRADWSAALDTPDAPIQLKIMDYGFCAFTIGEMDNVKWSPHNIPGTEGYRCCARTRPRRVCPP
jgi:serine/threonine protein kinase